MTRSDPCRPPFAAAREPGLAWIRRMAETWGARISRGCAREGYFCHPFFAAGSVRAKTAGKQTGGNHREQRERREWTTNSPGVPRLGGTPRPIRLIRHPNFRPTALSLTPWPRLRRTSQREGISCPGSIQGPMDSKRPRIGKVRFSQSMNALNPWATCRCGVGCDLAAQLDPVRRRVARQARNLPSSLHKPPPPKRPSRWPNPPEKAERAARTSAPLFPSADSKRCLTLVPRDSQQS